MNNFWFPDLNYDIAPNFDPDSKFVKFWRAEMDKFHNGFLIGGGQFRIGGWLYWHTVYWNIELDELMSNGESFKVPGIPKFRDIEFEIQYDCLNRAIEEKKGWSWIGSRGPGKSYILASIGGFYYTCYHDLQVVVGSSSSDFNDLLTQKIDYGLTRLPKRSLYKNRVLTDWNETVMAGVKEKGIRIGSNSRFEIRNYDDGNNPTAASGTRPKIHLIDEQGELPNLIACYDAGKQCWINDFGQFAIPILAGTGGNMNKGKQASLMFLNPKAHNLLEWPDLFENRKHPIGYFTPVTKARNEYKEEWTLYRYLTEKRGLTLKPHPDFERIKILVSNEEKCLEEFVKPRRAMAALSHEPGSLTSEIAFYPLTPTEAFTIVGNEMFPVELAKKQQNFLYEEQIRGSVVRLKRMPDDTVKREFCDDRIITEWPIKPNQDNSGATVIFEEPIFGAPDGLYIAGADPYAHDSSKSSTSVGALYIYKRMLKPDDTYIDEIVAYYVGRPETRAIWHKNAELLMDYYNAVCMAENETPTFVQYFDEKNMAYKLADGLQLLKEVAPNSDVKRTKGLPPTRAMINYGNGLVRDYMLEDIAVGSDPETGETIYKKGVIRIKDPMLLEEIINWQEDANCDRLVAFRHALMYNHSLKKFGHVQDYDSDTQGQAHHRLGEKKVGGYFRTGIGYFPTKKGWL